MCFSATASFTGGAIITLIGAAAIYKNKVPSRRVFATIPFVFGLQQISEGFVWTALESPGHDLMLKLSTYIFLFAALVVWPTIVPLSILLMERDRRRRIILYATLAVGVIVSLCHALGLLLFDATAQISNFHISYDINAPYTLGIAIAIAYLAATIPPMFVSSTKKIVFFGIVILISYIVAQVLYMENLASVWCFFAAIASAVIVWIVKEPVYGKNTVSKELSEPTVG